MPLPFKKQDEEVVYSSSEEELKKQREERAMVEEPLEAIELESYHNSLVDSNYSYSDEEWE